MPILYPVADHSGELVWADDLAAESRRPDPLSCLGCGGQLVLRAGDVNRPHFAHRDADACTSGETALHATACRVLSASLLAASTAGERYPMDVACSRCRAHRTTDLAAPGLAMVHDRVLADGIRPDLLGRRDDKDRFVIEVVVTHAPEQAALDLYAGRDLPTVVVRPSWETLAHLRHGLTSPLLQDSSGRPGSYEIMSQCRFPRHAEPGTLPCPTCNAPGRHLAAEISTAPCWRNNCRTAVRVLDLYDMSSDPPRPVAASCPDLPEAIKTFAGKLGVSLRWDRSQTAGGSYLMHQCGGCRGKQGDNFIYEPDGAVPQLNEPVHHVLVCSNGHLSTADPKAWQPGTDVERGAWSGGIHAVVGLVGERPGLFDDGASITVTRVAGHNIHAVVNRMLGLRD